MTKQFKPGGGAPDQGMVGLNLGRDLRRQLERVCSRQGISLTDYVRASVEREITKESFWKFQALRYLAQCFLLTLSTRFVEEKLRFSGPQSKGLRSELRRFIELVEEKANAEFESGLSPEQKAEYEKNVAFRKSWTNEPHWSFDIPSVERVLKWLGALSTI